MSKEKPYDPRLKECLAKIEALCREYECGGYVSLVSKTHGEFRYLLPAWAAMKEERNELEETTGVRLTCKKEQRELAELTAHFIHCGLDTAATGFQFFNHFVEETKKKWGTVHEPFVGFRPHRKEEH